MDRHHRQTMEPTLIGVCGPSCSGKTTACEQVSAMYEKKHPNLLRHLGMDHFYKDIEHAPRAEHDGREIVNWESVDAIDFDSFAVALDNLTRGKPAQWPQYSREENRRVGMDIVQPAPILLVEGLYLFARKDISDRFKLRVFVEATPETQYDRRVARGIKADREYFDNFVIGEYAKVHDEMFRRAIYKLDGDGTPAYLADGLGRLVKTMMTKEQLKHVAPRR
jgi:uridine kinase